MLIAFWIVVPLFFYIMVASASATHSFNKSIKSCKYDNHWGDGGWCNHCFTDTWLYGALWPFLIPASMGIAIGNRGTGMSRRDKRRANELEEARHRVLVAEEIAKENAILDKQLNGVSR